MMFQDYTPALQAIGAWIVGGNVGLVAGYTILLEPDFPETPDRAACLFESGGRWDWDGGQQEIELTLAVRGATAQDARSCVRVCLDSIMSGWRSYTTSQLSASGIRSITIGMPSFRGRDDRRRPILDVGIGVVLHRPFEAGVLR